MLQVRSFNEAMDGLEHELQKAGHDRQSPVAKQAKRTIRTLYYVEHEPIQKALEATVAIVKCTPVRKSEVDSSPVYSTDFKTQTPGQASAAATEALQTLGFRRERAARLQEMVPSASPEEIENFLNVRYTNWEGENGQETVNSNPQVAARLHEMPSDGTIWEPTDMADLRQRDMVDTIRDEVDGPFGTRNGFYMNPTRSELGSGGFASSGGAAIPAGTSEGPSVAQLSAAALQAAYASGVAAGSNGVAKARSRRR